MSILSDIKKTLGIEEEDETLDPELIIHINGAFLTLEQIGLGEGFSISDDTDDWSSLFGERLDMNSVKMFVYFTVRLSFDPPETSFVLSSIERQLTKIEWRIRNQLELGGE